MTCVVAWRRGVSLCVYALRFLSDEAPGDGLAWLYVDGGYLDSAACQRLAGVVASIPVEGPGIAPVPTASLSP